MANVFEKPQQAGFLEKLGTVLGGFGAGYQGRGTQFLQQQQAQRQQLSLERQKAAAEDMLKAKRLIEEGRLEDLRDLGFDRARMIEELGGDSADTRRIIDLTNYAMLGDKNSLDMLNSEINDGLYMAQQQGLIKGAPVQEWQDVIENGRVVGQKSRVTGEMKYLANRPEEKLQKPSAFQEKINALIDTGVSRENAVGIAAGRLTTSVNPLTGERVVVDLVSKKPVGEGSVPTPDIQQAEKPTTPLPTRPTAEMRDTLSNITGGEGALKSLANNIGSMFNVLPFAEQDRLSTELDALNKSAMLLGASEVSDKISVFTQQKIEQLLPKVNSFFSGNEMAYNNIVQLTKGFMQDIDRLQELVDEGKMRPSDVSKANQQISSLTKLVNGYMNLLNRGVKIDLSQFDNKGK